MTKQPSEKSIRQTIKRLRKAAAGRYVWRVQDKTTRAYCMEFTDFEKWEAEAWWKQHREQFPDYHRHHELARVHFRTSAERLMIKAAKMLEQLLAGKASG